MKSSKSVTRILSFLLLALAFQATTYAQTLKDFLGSKDAQSFYYGIDFTKCKVIDDPSASPAEMRDRYFESINDLIITETKKFDVNGAFHKSNIDHDLGYVNKRNSNVNEDNIKSTSSADFHRLKDTDIKNLVKGFDFGDKKGIGILLVAEAMSKSEKAIAVWVTLVDLKTKNVLLTDRVQAKTGMGFGFRNFWAAAFKNLLEEIEKKKFKEWKSQYGG